MIWPYNLVLTTFLNTFHAEEDSTSGKITRFKFFTIAFCGAFAWYFFPGQYHFSLLKMWWLTPTIAFAFRIHLYCALLLLVGLLD